jgi:hypothetical protein
MFDDDTAGNPGAAVAAWVCAVIIGLRVNDKRSAIIVEQAALSVEPPRCDIELQLSLAASSDEQVRKVTRVASLGIIPPVLVILRVPMRPRRSKVRPRTLPDTVEMDAMFSRREPAYVDFDRKALFLGVDKFSKTNGQAARIDYGRLRFIVEDVDAEDFLGCNGRYDERRAECEKCESFHESLSCIMS